jgi:polysaccharide biosynthesis protein PslH
MHMLLLTAELPFPPDSGPQVKTFHMLQHLTQAYRVCLVSFSGDTDATAAEILRNLGAEVHVVPVQRPTDRRLLDLRFGAAAVASAPADQHAVQQMHRLLAELTTRAKAHGEPFALVHADQMAMAPFALALDLPRLLDLHQLPWSDLEGRVSSQTGLAHWQLQRAIRALQRETAQIARGFNALTVVSEEDRRALTAIVSQQHDISVIPIAVDPQREAPIARDPEAQAILSLSALWRATNAEGVHWFARDVYPLVRRQAPACRLNICGAEPPAAIQALAQAQPTIRVTGYIDDPRPFIQTAGCQIVPLRSGSGMRVTILEALARGVPVVATGIGCADLDLQPGEHLLVADTPSEFADAVGVLLREPELGLRIAAAGRRQVIERYAWELVCPAIDPIYARIAPSVRHGTTRVLTPLGSRP